jgi:peptidylprolyl isomerase
MFIAHEKPGMLSMANSGPNSNSSQFFLTTTGTNYLDAKHVVFGMIEEGMDVLNAIEKVGSKSGVTSAEVVITDCGELKSKST